MGRLVASACGKAMEANPRFSLPQVLQAAALSFLGRDAEARASARRVSELEPSFTVGGFVRSQLRPRRDLEANRRRIAPAGSARVAQR